MKDDSTIREQMDACRPGKSDEMWPEMSALAASLESDSGVREAFAAAQHVDQRVQDAFQDVDVPAGLAGRLLAALDNADADNAAGDIDSTAALDSPDTAATGQNVAAEDVAAEDVVCRSVSTPAAESPTAGRSRHSRRPRHARRYLLWAASTLVAASFVGVLLYNNGVFTHKLTVKEVCEQTPSWLGKLPADRWQTEGLDELAAEIPSAVRPEVGWFAWQQTRTPLGETKVLEGNFQGCGVYLLITKAKGASLPTAPPAQPRSPTGRMTIGVWGKGKFVYVLAVQGNERWYHRLLRQFESVG